MHWKPAQHHIQNVLAGPLSQTCSPRVNAQARKHVETETMLQRITFRSGCHSDCCSTSYEGVLMHKAKQDHASRLPEPSIGVIIPLHGTGCAAETSARARMSNWAVQPLPYWVLGCHGPNAAYLLEAGAIAVPSCCSPAGPRSINLRSGSLFIIRNMLGLQHCP